MHRNILNCIVTLNWPKCESAVTQMQLLLSYCPHGTLKMSRMRLCGWYVPFCDALQMTEILVTRISRSHLTHNEYTKYLNIQTNSIRYRYNIDCDVTLVKHHQCHNGNQKVTSFFITLYFLNCRKFF